MNHQDYMRVAIEEANKGLGLTSPNPNVGAVIVKSGEIIGVGWHRKTGKPHAEREAIADALQTHKSTDIQGSTIYVTLEPCSTRGRTGACTDAIIDAGITQVVYGATDPNPEHAGRADDVLKKNDIEVISGVEQAACELLIRPFTKRIKTGLPWVIAKTAVSLDGRITRPMGEGQWLTGELARNEVHHIRASVDAIITGGKTARKDNPSLTIRGEAFSDDKEQPWRVVLTQHGKQNLPSDLNIFIDDHKDRTIIFEDKTLTETLTELAELGCNSVMLECGGGLMRQFIEQDLVDELAMFMAPLITGGLNFGFGSGDHLPHSYHLVDTTSKTFGNDLMIRGLLTR